MSKSRERAFPAPNFIVPQDLSDEGVQRLGETQGMSLRDYFAAKAMQGLIAAGRDISLEFLIPQSYRIADGMLEERGKEHD